MNKSNDMNVAEVLQVTEERAEAIVKECYDVIDKMREEQRDSPMTAVLLHMKTVGLTEAEIFLSGFILGRVYQSFDNMASTAVSPDRMFE